MYNRYIPQNDGSYSRKSIQSRPQGKSDPPPLQPKLNLEQHSEPHINYESAKPSGLLRQLLPKEFDTEDLLIILLLLLMTGENEEERKNALLTLALYFFL